MPLLKREAVLPLASVNQASAFCFHVFTGAVMAVWYEGLVGL